jgi:hypothetical protein
MKTSIWHHTADRQPDKSGYYMGFRTVTLADDTCGVDYFYWNQSEGQWRTDSTCHSHWANVYYWTEDDPEQWVDTDPPVRYRKAPKSNPALAIAWQNVQDAVRKYELVKQLVGNEQLSD